MQGVPRDGACVVSGWPKPDEEADWGDVELAAERARLESEFEEERMVELTLDVSRFEAALEVDELLRQRTGATQEEVDELRGLGLIPPLPEEPRPSLLDALLAEVAEMVRPLLEWLADTAAAVGRALREAGVKLRPRRERKSDRRAREAREVQARKAARDARREEQRRNQGWTQ